MCTTRTLICISNVRKNVSNFSEMQAADAIYDESSIEERSCEIKNAMN